MRCRALSSHPPRPWDNYPARAPRGDQQPPSSSRHRAPLITFWSRTPTHAPETKDFRGPGGKNPGGSSLSETQDVSSSMRTCGSAYCLATTLLLIYITWPVIYYAICYDV
jgi:hypothetical protein